ncbi:ABC transporter permease [Streptomyces sp. CA-294286]|uniref:ABC transporter permease n=1 Tax=Streptomyces sp. CA-294286 TaxID=3240070 RepID=UPI003D912962
MNAVLRTVGDASVVAQRNMIKIKRVPDLLIFASLSPIMFVLLFAYVFGSSIEVPGIDYREFLIAGIFAQTILFSSVITGMGLAEDIQKGLIDRLRSLPMSRSAVLIGRTSSDLAYNLLILMVMAVTGLIVGWRIRTGFEEAVAGFALLLAFAYAVSWIMATVGLAVQQPEVVNNAAGMLAFPLSFIANTFVPSENLPGPLRVFAEWNPVSAVTQATRELFGNTSPTSAAALSDAWPMQNALLASLLWIALILAVFVPLSIRQYRKAIG